MPNIIVSVILTLIEAILLFTLLYKVVCSRFTGRFSVISQISAILVYTASVCLLHNLPGIVKFIFYVIIALVISCIVYTAKPYIMAFYILVANYIFLISDILIGNMSEFLTSVNIRNILNTMTNSLQVAILAKVLNVVLFTVCIYYFKKLAFEIPKKYWILMDILVLLLMTALQFIMQISPMLQNQSKNYPMHIFAISIGFLVIGGLLVYIFSEICFYHEREKKFFILDARNHFLEQQLAYHESATLNLQTIRHDINKNLANISSLLKDNNIAGSISYIDAITHVLEKSKPIYNCGNDIINAIANYKASECKQHKIELDMIIDRIPSLEIDPVDLTAILANLFDNAIEAVDMIDNGKKYISGKIYYYKNYLVIVIENPYKQRPVIENGSIRTHKKDKKFHGYGLASIRSSAEKHGGIFKVAVKEGAFTAMVMLPINVPKQQ